MSDIKINLDQLAGLSTRLSTVARDLDSAEQFSDGVAGVVGNDRLANVLRDFASKWNLRRQDLIEKVELTAAAAQAIHDTFEELDREIAAGISGKGSK